MSKSIVHPRFTAEWLDQTKGRNMKQTFPKMDIFLRINFSAILALCETASFYPYGHQFHKQVCENSFITVCMKLKSIKLLYYILTQNRFVNICRYLPNVTRWLHTILIYRHNRKETGLYIGTLVVESW